MVIQKIVVNSQGAKSIALPDPPLKEFSSFELNYNINKTNELIINSIKLIIYSTSQNVKKNTVTENSEPNNISITSDEINYVINGTKTGQKFTINTYNPIKHNPSNFYPINNNPGNFYLINYNYSINDGITDNILYSNNNIGINGTFTNILIKSNITTYTIYNNNTNNKSIPLPGSHYNNRNYKINLYNLPSDLITTLQNYF